MTKQDAGTNIRFRPMRADDLPAVHALCVAVKWPHRLEDWAFALELGTGILAEDPSGILGTAMHWKHGAHHASLGMVIVSPLQQGRGIGRDLMNRTLAALDGRTTFLNATIAGQPLYEKLGFSAVDRVFQHQGIAAVDNPTAVPADGQSIRDIGVSDLVSLARLLSDAAGYDRTDVLRAILEIGQGVAIAQDGELRSFALIRKFGRDLAIGPVVADSIEAAKVLVSHLIKSNANRFVRIDITSSADFSAWLESIGLQKVSNVVTMVKGDAPHHATHSPHLYAIANQALC